MNTYVQMTCYDASGTEEDDRAVLTVPSTEGANFISPTVHIRAFPSGGESNGGVRRSPFARLTVCFLRLRNRWKAYTGLERTLFVIVGGLATVIALILPALISAYLNFSAGQDVRVVRISHGEEASSSSDDGCGLCTSHACVTASSWIMSAMDPSVDPCQDFFQYACGRWIRNNPIPEGKSTWGTFDRLWQDNQIVMKTILEQPAASLVSEAEKSAQRYYQSCLDLNETVESLGSRPMLELVSRIGGWPAIDPSIDDRSWDFQQAIQTAHNLMNMGGFFTWAVAEDDKNSSRHVIQSGLTLPNRDYYLNKSDTDEVLVAYLDYMAKVGVLLNPSADANTTRRHMRDVIELEKRIAKITVSSAERRDEEKLYHALSIADLGNLAPFINWTSYFHSAFSQVNITITPSHVVVVYSPDFLRNLSSIVNEMLATEKGKTALHNYMGWHVVRNYLSCLPKAFRDADKVLRKLLMGSDGSEESWRSCVTDTNNVMGFAVGAMFVRQNFHGESKPLAEAMISSVKQAFKDNFDNLDWMDDETRRVAREKADAITDMIGYPKFILNPKELDELYKDFRIESNEYFMNNVRANQFSFRQNLLKLNEPVNKTLWGMTPSTVNAYYTPNKNQIVFPAGILQPPFFDITYPNALNFGAMGVVMGHELTHAFDDQGREFDRDGDLAPWWNNETINRFQKRTECLVEQYSSFNYNGQSLNGKQTLGENIADNGGLKAAFHAFTNWTDVHDDELYLPGLNVTHKQLFFLSFAQVWCSSSTREALHLQILNDPHSPARYRVMGPLTNMPEFSSVFQCPAGSPMNPKRKCEIW